MQKTNRIRCITQVVTALLYNCNFLGFTRGTLYRGPSKGVCVPGLNCYSCPGAIGGCPLGSLQSALVSSKHKVPYYILGFLLLLGVLFGRFICGFLCPFGFLQELLHKIPTPKLKKSKATRILSYLKYVILVLFVIVIPLVLAVPGFCKYICPAGTLEAGVPMVIADMSLRQIVGGLYVWKIALCVLILVAAVFIYRVFCRFICPLGAFYSLFNRIAVVGIKVDENKCNHCNACVRICKMDVKKLGDHECIMCGECMNHCSACAISYCRKNKAK